jgi:hypothetical protein
MCSSVMVKRCLKAGSVSSSPSNTQEDTLIPSISLFWDANETWLVRGMVTLSAGNSGAMGKPDRPQATPMPPHPGGERVERSQTERSRIALREQVLFAQRSR